jgi:hypothetical protein
LAGIAIAAVSIVKMCYHSMMKWLQWTPNRNGILGVVFAILAVLAVVGFMMIYFPPHIQLSGMNAGFGPEWECTSQAIGGPVCIKKLGK